MPPNTEENKQQPDANTNGNQASAGAANGESRKNANAEILVRETMLASDCCRDTP